MQVNETHIIVDANHPMAGETLNFDVEIISVVEPSKEETSDL